MNSFTRSRLGYTFIFSGLFFMIFLNTSCKNPHERELQMLDTLDTMLEKTRQYLEIDLTEINTRYLEMDLSQKVIFHFYKLPIDPEMSLFMGRYKAIFKVYKKFLADYEALFNKRNHLVKQVKNLRQSVKDNQLTREKFKEFFAIEKENVRLLHDKSQLYGKRIYELEPEYARFSPNVDELVEKLENENPEVKKYMAENFGKTQEVIGGEESD